MRSAQELFNELQENKKEQKEISKEYKDTLVNANEYEETDEKLKELREKKKQIEGIVKSRMGLRYGKLEDLKAKAEELNQMITDIAMSTMMEGKTIEIKDQYGNSFEPVYKISFKKID